MVGSWPHTVQSRSKSGREKKFVGLTSNLLPSTMVCFYALALVVVLGLVCPVVGSGPDYLMKPPVWNYTMNYCWLFRNESVLRPYFKVWPEDIPGAPAFRYCCEYQPTDDSKLNLSNYRYGPDEGALQPRPYYDLGIVNDFASYWKHWRFWRLPITKYAVLIQCDSTDLHRLYRYRLWRKTVPRGSITAGVLLAVVVIVFGSGRACNRDRIWHWEELLSDLAHLFLLPLVGCCMMEAVGHSRLQGWRSTFFYNTGVVYTYLTLFALASSLVRHFVPLRWKQNVGKDWRWQKVFAQLASLFLMGTYLGFVDDATGQSLDSVAGIVFAAVVVACVWTAGMELLVICKLFLPRGDPQASEESPHHRSRLDPCLQNGACLPSFNQAHSFPWV